MSRDTYEGELENPLSRHLYVYVQNNPIIHIDPSGRVTILIHGIIADISNMNTMATYLKNNGIPDVYTFEWTDRYFIWGLGNVIGAMFNFGGVQIEFADFIKSKRKAGKPLNIVAHSGGGQISIEAAMRIKNITINKLILLDSPIHQYAKPPNIKKIYLTYSNHISSIGTRDMSLQWRLSWFESHGFTNKVPHTGFWTNSEVKKYVLGKLKQ